MNNHSNAISIIKALTGQANLITIPREYVNFMGSLDGGLFLSQLIYWSDKGGEWFYKTYDEWEKEICLSKYEVSKQARILKKRGVLKTQVKRANGAPTVHYQFLFDEFEKSFVKFLNNRKSSFLTIESEETEQSLTDTTSYTTTKNNKIALCKTCRENPVPNPGEVCQECTDKKDERYAKNAFATEVIDAWNTVFSGIPPVITKENTTIRISLATNVQKYGITETERGIRDTLKDLYSNPGFRAHWRDSLEAAAATPGLLIKTWFKFEYWLKLQTTRDGVTNKTPVYVRCLDGTYTFLTERDTVQNVPVFNQPIEHVPGNPGF